MHHFPSPIPTSRIQGYASMPEACFPQSPAASDKKGESLFLAERKETQPQTQCRTQLAPAKTAMPPAPSILRRTIAKAPSVRPPPSPQKRRKRQAPARGVGVRRIRANGAGRRALPPPARGAGVLFSVRHPGARGKEGAVPCDAALPRRGKGRCRCAGSTLFAPAGQKRFRVARLILGGSRGKAVYGAVCPSRTVWQARRGNGSVPSCAP